jgi:DNA polymerase
MKNLHNALLLKQLYQLKQLGYRYTSITPYQEEKIDLALPDTLGSVPASAEIRVGQDGHGLCGRGEMGC